MRSVEDRTEPPEDPLKREWRRVAEEDRLVAILDEPRVEGEQIDVTFRRKEQQLGEIFAGLSAVDSLELERRLCMRLPDDELAARFGGLTPLRQARLLAFLMSARRRFAIARRGDSRE